MQDFAALLDSQFASYRKSFKQGERVKAKILRIGAEYVFLDVGARNEGLLPVECVRGEDGKIAVASGGDIDVVYTGQDRDVPMFAVPGVRAGDALRDNSIADAFNSGLPVEGTVEKEIKGGYQVLVSGRRGFCPYSQIDRIRCDASEYIGKKFSFAVQEYSHDDMGENLIVSRRAIFDREDAEKREQLKDTLVEGMTINGTVTRLVDFGLFVDIGGIEGLVPLRELSRAMNVKPADVAKEGDIVTVKILSLDWDAGRVSLSIKECSPDPWDEAFSRFPQGTEFTGKVSKIKPFGVFVTIVPGVDGLIPVSKLANGRANVNPASMVKVGESLRVKVDAVDAAQRRFSLRPVVAGANAAEPEEDSENEQRTVEEWLEKSKAAQKSFGNLSSAFDGLGL